jgi:hypothetical protein
VKGFPLRVMDPVEPTHQQISAFVAAHHSAANRGDLNALLKDYADQVLYSSNGWVDKNFIYKDESKSRSSYLSMAEEIVYPIVIKQIGPADFLAEYKLVYQAMKRNKQSLNGSSNVYLFLVPTPNGFKIYRQQNHL